MSEDKEYYLKKILEKKVEITYAHKTFIINYTSIYHQCYLLFEKCLMELLKKMHESKILQPMQDLPHKNSVSENAGEKLVEKIILFNVNESGSSCEFQIYERGKLDNVSICNMIRHHTLKENKIAVNMQVQCAYFKPLSK